MLLYNHAAAARGKVNRIVAIKSIRKPFCSFVVMHFRAALCLSESCIRLILFESSNEDDDDDASGGSAIAVELRINGESLSCRSAYYVLRVRRVLLNPSCRMHRTNNGQVFPLLLFARTHTFA